MLRFLNLSLAFIVLTVAAAFGNYQVKESAVRAAKALKATEAAIAEQEVALRMLDAEWSYLNDPSRLQDLASRHLALSQIRPDQVVAAVEMPERLPFEVGARRERMQPAPRRVPQAPADEPARSFMATARAEALAALSAHQ